MLGRTVAQAISGPPHLLALGKGRDVRVRRGEGGRGSHNGYVTARKARMYDIDNIDSDDE